MADIESWETKVLRDHTEMLEIALVPELLFVANELNKAYLLSDTELEEIKAVPSLLTIAQKAGKIVSALKGRVKLNSNNFEKFVHILKKKPQIFETIIKMLSISDKVAGKITITDLEHVIMCMLYKNFQVRIIGGHFNILHLLIYVRTFMMHYCLSLCAL